MIFTLLLLVLGIQAVKQIEARRLLVLLNQRNKAIMDAMLVLLLTMRADGPIIDREVQDTFPLAWPAEN